jgi:hypothetical protein
MTHLNDAGEPMRWDALALAAVRSVAGRLPGGEITAAFARRIHGKPAGAAADLRQKQAGVVPGCAPAR